MGELAQKAVAVVVLAAAAFVLLKLAIGAVTALVWTVVGILALVALLWALNRVL